MVKYFCSMICPYCTTYWRLKSVTVSKIYSSKVKLILQSTPLRDHCSHDSYTLPFSPFGICYTSMLCMYKCMLAWSVQLMLYTLEIVVSLKFDTLYNYHKIAGSVIIPHHQVKLIGNSTTVWLLKDGPLIHCKNLE